MQAANLPGKTRGTDRKYKLNLCSEGPKPFATTLGPKKNISISFLWGHPYLIGLRYKGVYMGYASPYFCLCAFLGGGPNSKFSALWTPRVCRIMAGPSFYLFFFLGGGLGLKLSIGAKEETNREIIGALQKSRCWQVKV